MLGATSTRHNCIVIDTQVCIVQQIAEADFATPARRHRRRRRRGVDPRFPLPGKDIDRPAHPYGLYICIACGQAVSPILCMQQQRQPTPFSRCYEDNSSTVVVWRCGIIAYLHTSVGTPLQHTNKGYLPRRQSVAVDGACGRSLSSLGSASSRTVLCVLIGGTHASWRWMGFRVKPSLHMQVYQKAGHKDNGTLKTKSYSTLLLC